MSTTIQWTRPQIEKTVCAVISESLGQGEGEIHLDDRLVENLEVEPSDLLDIVYQLGKAFHFRFGKREYVSLLISTARGREALGSNETFERREEVFDQNPEYFWSPSVRRICDEIEHKLQER